MPKTIITIAATKGGTSKSTTSWALGTFLSQENKTLLWDNDPQGSLTSAVASSCERSVFDVLAYKTPVRDTITKALPQYGDKLFIVPSSHPLTGLEAATASDLARQYMLVDALADLHEYSVIVVDTPAGQGVLTTASIVAADVVLTPVACQPAAYETLNTFAETVALIKQRMNRKLRWLIVPAIFDQRQVLDRDVLAVIRDRYGELILDPPIRKRVAIAEDMAAQRPCNHQDYELLTSNLLGRIQNYEG